MPRGRSHARTPAPMSSGGEYSHEVLRARIEERLAAEREQNIALCHDIFQSARQGWDAHQLPADRERMMGVWYLLEEYLPAERAAQEWERCTTGISPVLRSELMRVIADTSGTEAARAMMTMTRKMSQPQPFRVTYTEHMETLAFLQAAVQHASDAQLVDLLRQASDDENHDEQWRALGPREVQEIRALWQAKEALQGWRMGSGSTRRDLPRFFLDEREDERDRLLALRGPADDLLFRLREVDAYETVETVDEWCAWLRTAMRQAHARNWESAHIRAFVGTQALYDTVVRRETTAGRGGMEAFLEYEFEDEVDTWRTFHQGFRLGNTTLYVATAVFAEDDPEVANPDQLVVPVHPVASADAVGGGPRRCRHMSVSWWRNNPGDASAARCLECGRGAVAVVPYHMLPHEQQSRYLGEEDSDEEYLVKHNAYRLLRGQEPDTDLQEMRARDGLHPFFLRSSRVRILGEHAADVSDTLFGED